MHRVALIAVDTGVATVGPRSDVSTPSPGLAIIGSVVQVGLDAERAARLKPRRVHSRFWQDLGDQPLGRPFPEHLRTSDLVHAHLDEVWRHVGRGVDEALLVLPGTYTRDQLALLLGIAASAAIPVRGMVDLATAAAAGRATHPRCLHLDLHLHRAVLSELKHGPEVVRGRVWEDGRVGAAALEDLWARTLARLFIRDSRFDPFHHAETEQLLYLTVPRHVRDLRHHSSTRVSIASGGRQHAVDVERRDLVEVSRDVTEMLSAWVFAHTGEEATTVLLGDRAAWIPGLVEQLARRASLDIQIVHPTAAGAAALSHAERIRSSAAALPLVTRLPGYHARPPGPVTIAINPPPGGAATTLTPTHLVVDGVVRAVGDAATVIAETTGTPGAPGVDNPGSGTLTSVVVRRVGDQVMVEAPRGVRLTVNGIPVEGRAALAAGDRLVVIETGSEVLLVRMAP